MRIPRKVLGALGVGVLVAGTWFTGPTLAQSDDRDTEADRPTREEIQERRAEHREEFLGALADELDVSVDDLTAALETVREQFAQERQERCEERRPEIRENLVERLRDKVDEGDLTEEEAREILERFDERDCENGPLHRPARRGVGPRVGGGFDGPPSAGAENAVIDAA